MGFVWFGEKLFSIGATDYELPDWAMYVILGVVILVVGGLAAFMFWNSRASAIINLAFMSVNVFFLFFSISEVRFLNPYDLQTASPEGFLEKFALGTWVWEAIMFAMASLSVTANIHTFFTDGKYESFYVDQHGRIGSETKGLDETQKTWLAFGIMLGVSAGAIALSLYVSMWWLLGYSIALLCLSVVQVIVTFILHEKLDD